jgi:hypothetical protein
LQQRIWDSVQLKVFVRGDDLKVIFLDIDGVMNTDTHLVRSDVHEGLEFCPIAVRILKEVIEETGAKIVISSTWRFGRTIEELQDLFRHYDETIADSIIGKTAQYAINERGYEIRCYIEGVYDTDHEVTDFVVIDDDDFDMARVRYNLVRCYNDQQLRGLTEDLKPRILKLLG